MKFTIIEKVLIAIVVVLTLLACFAMIYVFPQHIGVR